MNIDQILTKMEARRVQQEIHLFLLINFFLFFTFSFQAAISSPITDKNSAEETKKLVLEELKKVVGLPNYAARDHGEWTVRSVRFILEKMNWKFNFTGKDKPDVKVLEEAAKKIATAINWIVDDPELNPYRSLTERSITFARLFQYLKALEKKYVFGGEKNPVYVCYKAFWPTCESREPATLEGAVVNRFECAWEFYEKCVLRRWSISQRKLAEASGDYSRQESTVKPSKAAGDYNRGCTKSLMCRS